MNARFFINKFPRAKGKPYFETTYDMPGKLGWAKRSMMTFNSFMIFVIKNYSLLLKSLVIKVPCLS